MRTSSFVIGVLTIGGVLCALAGKDGALILIVAALVVLIVRAVVET